MIPADVLAELRYLEVYTAKKIRNLRVGPYTSPLRGTGFDFDEHRPYRPGDDVRRIDWNVTARLNAPFLRQTHAERELTVTIALDLSPSMTVGSSRYSKKEVMTFIAASLLFSAVTDQINVGLLAFSDRVLYPLYELHDKGGVAAALGDQVLAGVVMWVPMSLAYLVPAVLLTVRLLSPATNRVNDGASRRSVREPTPLYAEPAG